MTSGKQNYMGGECSQVICFQYATAEGCITALADYWPERFGHKGAHLWRFGVCALAMTMGLPQLLDVSQVKLYWAYGMSAV